MSYIRYRQALGQTLRVDPSKLVPLAPVTMPSDETVLHPEDVVPSRCESGDDEGKFIYHRKLNRMYVCCGGRVRRVDNKDGLFVGCCDGHPATVTKKVNKLIAESGLKSNSEREKDFAAFNRDVVCPLFRKDIAEKERREQEEEERAAQRRKFLLFGSIGVVAAVGLIIWKRRG